MSCQNIVKKLLAWFEENARDLPWRNRRDPYAIWVSEVMLQQTQVRTVIPYWERWMVALPTVEALAQAAPERIHKLWEGLGYYTRVRNMQRAAQRIIAHHGGVFPVRFEDVLALPGIGRYTAGAICSIALHQPRAVVDGNVTRVLARLFAVVGDPRERVTNARLWGMAERLVGVAAELAGKEPRRRNRRPHLPAGRRWHPVSALNQSLMELGAVVCTPREPHCPDCPVRTFCRARRQGRVQELPMVRPRAPLTPKRVVAFLARRGDRWFVRQRPAGMVNGHLWEFPNVECEVADTELKEMARRSLGATPTHLERLGSIRHTITRYRITLEAYRARLGRVGSEKTAPGQWLRACQLARLPFASAHRKLLSLLDG